MATTRKFAVMGQPIAHSLSPYLHRYFAKLCGFSCDYQAISVSPSEFESKCSEFIAAGGSGLNITAPLKKIAFTHVDSLSAEAQDALAVNMITVTDHSTLLGGNSDTAGFTMDICQSLGWNIQQKRVLIVGSGDVVGSVILALHKLRPEVIYLINRTPQKIKHWLTHFHTLPELLGVDGNLLTLPVFDVIINATSASLQGKIPEIPKQCITPKTLCYDMVYMKTPTVFIQWAQSAGVTTVADGLGMLICLAKICFEQWHQISLGDLQTLKRQLLKELPWQTNLS